MTQKQYEFYRLLLYHANRRLHQDDPDEWWGWSQAADTIRQMGRADFHAWMYQNQTWYTAAHFQLSKAYQTFAQPLHAAIAAKGTVHA